MKAVNSVVKITREGLEELKKELVFRKTTKKKELQNTLEETRSAGDLSENDGYTLAIEDFKSNENRILELETLLKNAKIITNTDSNKVSLGSVVTIKNGEQKQVTIVGETESDPLNDKISANSPMGIGLMGKTCGDKIKVETPKGFIEYEILRID